MNLTQLFEMPTLRPTELVPKTARPFYTNASLSRNYKFIHKGETAEGLQYWCVIKNNKHTAAIGVPGKRDDGAVGMDVLGIIDFKPAVTLSGLHELPVSSHVLQVALVEVVPNRQSQGWGMYLYTALAEAGYVVVSDNTQYLGGQALWKRIAGETMHGRYKVYVLKHGVPVEDETGNPFVYNGMNIADAELWSTNADQKYTLFALTAG